MFKKTFFLTMSALFALTLIATSCSEDNNDLKTEVDETTPVKTSFKFLTINHSSSHGDSPSLSHVAHDGTVTSDVFYSANGSTMPDKMSEFNLIGDKFYATRSGLNSKWYLDAFIHVMDTATFKIEKTIELKYDDTLQELNLNSTVKLPNGLLLSAGALSNDETIQNFAIISPDDNSIVSSTRLDFAVKKMIYTQNKIFMAGPESNFKLNKIAVIDENNPNAEAIRTICNGSLFDGSSPTMLIDSKGMIWAAIHDEERASVICIDPKSEAVIHRINLPYSITPLSSVGMAIDKAAKWLYIRTGRAFYKLDTSSDKEPEDVAFEITSEVVDGGMTCADLKMGYNGNLLFIRSISDKGKSCEVYELNPETWETVEIYTTNINSRYIYTVN